MPPELAQWITPAVVVAVLLYMHRSIRRDRTQMETRLRQDMKEMESRFETRMDRMESRLREDMERLDRRVARLEHGQAKLEGLLEGLREAITRQPAA